MHSASDSPIENGGGQSTEQPKEKEDRQGGHGNRKRDHEHVSSASSPQKRRRTMQTNNPEPATAHGSYVQYYKRRADVVSRVRLLERGWVEGCRILDVGCNDGAVVLALAKGKTRKARQKSAPAGDIAGVLTEACSARTAESSIPALTQTGGATEAGCQPAVGSSLGVPRPPAPEPPARVVGVDIDAGLIERARLQLRLARSQREIRASEVEFRCEDFAGVAPGRTSSEVGEYDVVTLLSVTKWVHLHGGDAALKRLFARVRDCLRPGGVLVLEPQPWNSYRRARAKARKEAVNARLAHSRQTANVGDLRLRETAEAGEIGAAAIVHPELNGQSGETPVANAPPTTSSDGGTAAIELDSTGLAALSSLLLRPDRFSEFLLSSEGGFSHMHVLRDVSASQNQPFNRAVMAFFKRG